MSIIEGAPLDAEKLEQFVFRAVDEVGATLNAALVVMGDRLGLYRALAGAGPMTPAELAARTGTGRALRARVAQRPGRRRLRRVRPDRRPLHACRRAGRRAGRRGQPGLPARASSRSRSAPCSTRRASSRPRAAAPASAGTSTTTTSTTAASGSSGPATTRTWSPLAARARRRRRPSSSAAPRVADVGCGHGASTILMAQAFPSSTFVGSDYHAGSIETARAARREAGVADRVRFEVRRRRRTPARATTW